MSGLSEELNELQSNLLLNEAKWIGKERSYKRTIGELEKKVHDIIKHTVHVYMCKCDASHLKVETKLGDFKKKRVVFLEMARDHEKVIMQGLSAETEGGIPGHSPIRPATPGCTGYQVFPVSPTLPSSSGFSPGTTGLGIAGKSSPPYDLKYPTTSTPAGLSSYR